MEKESARSAAGPSDRSDSKWGLAVKPVDALSEHDFRRLCRLIHDYCGIVISSGKRTLLEGRISRRMNRLGLSAYREYCEYLYSNQGMTQELLPMIDAVTTNKTDFFREPWHFKFLVDRAYPILQKLYGAGTSRKLSVWSAACSSGEEPYTLAMVLANKAKENPQFKYEILATDISSKILEAARNAVYDHERADPIPLAMRKKYLLRSRDHTKNLVKIHPALQDHISFLRLNLKDASYGLPHLMDAIFCRNVIIYFDRATQEQIINRLCRCLVPGGFLFMGHAESLSSMKVPLNYIEDSTYQKRMEDRV
jgi:chemotaxis protein methyltransferase CheR